MAKPNNTAPKKQFAPEVGFWPTKSGNGYTVFLDEKTMETLAKAELGGRLYLQEVDTAVREKNNKAPHYRISIFAPQEQQQQPRAKEADGI